jgi:quinol monooxygenase YgiN
MIIVSGRIFVQAGKHDEFVQTSRKAMIQARETKGCLDFVVAADPLDQDRVNVYEEWVSVTDLDRFRGSGPDSDTMELIERADVS